MRGHEALIAMRKARLAPEMVYIDLGAPSWMTAMWRQVCPQYPQLAITDDEAIASLDLRFVVGLHTQVSGSDRGRLQAAVMACAAAGASRVVGVLTRPGRFDVELLEVTDTKGELSWRKS